MLLNDHFIDVNCGVHENELFLIEKDHLGGDDLFQ